MSETESEETTSTPEPSESTAEPDEFEQKVAAVDVSSLEVPRNQWGLVEWEELDQSQFTPEQLIALSDDHNERARALSPDELKAVDLAFREKRRETGDAEKYERIRKKAEDAFYGSDPPQVRMVQLERLLLLYPDHADVLGYMEGVSMEMSGDVPDGASLDDVSFDERMSEKEAFELTQDDEEKLDAQDD